MRVTKIGNRQAIEKEGGLEGSDPAGQDQGDIVRLFGGANPILDRGNGVFGDPFQRQVAIVGNGFDKTLFAKFSKFIFRLGNAVAEGDKNVAWIQLHCFFFIIAVMEQANHRASGFQAADRAVGRQNNGRKMAGIGIGQPVFLVVIETQEKRGVLFRLRALKQMPVQKPKHLRG